MVELAIVQGIGIVLFLLFYFTNNLDKEHVFLKLFLNIFTVILMLILPAYMATDSLSLLDIFYKGYVAVIIIFSVYLFIYLNYYLWIKSLAVKFKRIK